MADTLLEQIQNPSNDDFVIIFPLLALGFYWKAALLVLAVI